MFSGGIETDQWHEMSYQVLSHRKQILSCTENFERLLAGNKVKLPSLLIPPNLDMKVECF